MAVESDEALDDGVLRRVERKNLMVLRVFEELAFAAANLRLQLGDALLEYLVGRVVASVLRSRFGDEGVSDGVDDARGDARVLVPVGDVISRVSLSADESPSPLDVQARRIAST